MSAGRLEAARQTARAIGAALRAARLYSTGHATTRQSIATAQLALHAYLADFGPLSITGLPNGVRFDFHSQPSEDELTAEFGRTMHTTMVAELRFLPGATVHDIAHLVQVLQMPKTALDRLGGAGNALRGRGVATVAATDVTAPPAAAAIADPLTPLADTLRGSPAQFVPILLNGVQQDAAAAAQRLREIDPIIATWSKANQAAAWDAVAGGLVTLPTTVHAALVGHVVRATGEPWAASIAARWPATPIAGLVADDPEVRASVTDVAGMLRSLHRAPPQVALPGVEAPPADAFAQAARGIADATSFQLRARAVVRLLEAVRDVEPRRAAECLGLVEREIIPVIEAGDVTTVVAVVNGLAALSHRLQDARADLARASLRRVLAAGVGDLLVRMLAERATEHEPLHRALHAAPDETVPMLLELLADDERIQVRRAILSLLVSVARGRVALIADHLVDPRWFVARNVATVLGEMRDPAGVAYLRAVLAHADPRVRKEALQALAAVRTPDATAVLRAALTHPDPSTREAAAHWLKTVDLGSDA